MNEQEARDLLVRASKAKGEAKAYGIAAIAMLGIVRRIPPEQVTDELLIELHTRFAEGNPEYLEDAVALTLAMNGYEAEREYEDSMKLLAEGGAFHKPSRPRATLGPAGPHCWDCGSFRLEYAEKTIRYAEMSEFVGDVVVFSSTDWEQGEDFEDPHLVCADCGQDMSIDGLTIDWE